MEGGPNLLSKRLGFKDNIRGDRGAYSATACDKGAGLPVIIVYYLGVLKRVRIRAKTALEGGGD